MNYPNKPKNDMVPIPVINLSGSRIGAGPIASVGIDVSSGFHSIKKASTDCGCFAEMLMPLALNHGQQGLAYLNVCQFSPDANLSTGSVNQKVWLGANGECTLTTPSTHDADALTQFIGYLAAPGSGAGNGIVDGWLLSPSKWGGSSQTIPYAHRMCLTNSQSLANAVGLAIPWDTTSYTFTHGNNAWWSSEHPEKFVIPSSGVYSVNGSCKFAALAGGTRRLRIFMNGSVLLDEDQLPADTNEISLHVNTQWNFTAGDYIWMEAFQNSGSNMTLHSLIQNNPSLMVCKI